MKIASAVAAALAASSLVGCATPGGGGFPQGPALTYEQLLPNTHENPAWARNARPDSTQQTPDTPPASPAATAPR